MKTNTLKNSALSLTTPFSKFSLRTIASACLLTAFATLAQPLDKEQSDDLVELIESGQIAKISQVIDHGLDIDQEFEGDGTPLIIAVRNGDKALVEYLVSRGADVNKASIPDGNPLINAAITNNVELLYFLYQHGAKLDDIVEHDETALISASKAGAFQAVKFLVEQGADVNLAVKARTIRGSELRSPLSVAKNNEIKAYLLAQGATQSNASQEVYAP